MEISIKYGTKHLDWEEVCEVIRLAPLGTRDPEKLRSASVRMVTINDGKIG
jgi:hypothetical protein